MKRALGSPVLLKSHSLLMHSKAYWRLPFSLSKALTRCQYHLYLG